MDPRTVYDLKKFASALSQKLAGQEKFLTGRLASRLNKALKDFPGDQTIAGMASFLTRRAESTNGSFINRAELVDVYNRLYTKNTKCAAFISDELGIKVAQEEPKPMTRNAEEGSIIEDLYVKYADKKLKNEMSFLFDKEAKRRNYSEDNAKIAISKVAEYLPGKPAISAVDGNDEVIVCQATYETPKGKCGVIVPVEMVGNKASRPSAFMSTAGFVDLNEKSLMVHFEKTAGKNFQVDTGKIIEAVKVAKHGYDPDSNVERIVRLHKMASAKSEIQGIYTQIDPAEKVAEAASEESKSFADKLSNPVGMAEFVHGKDAVAMAKNYVLKTFANTGYNNVQIKIESVNEKQVTFAAALGHAGVKIPVKIASGKPALPNVVLANGSIFEFTSEGIQQAVAKDDRRIAVAAHGLGSSNPNQLLTKLASAIETNDRVQIDAILDAVYVSGDSVAFKAAFTMVNDALTKPVVKTASTTPKMKTVKIGGNIVEATTGLPVDKVYMDENGVVHAKHRQNEDKVDNSAYMFTNKIYMGM